MDLSTQLSTLALVPQIVAAVSIPVIAAGGISDAAGVSATMQLGAAGVQEAIYCMLMMEGKFIAGSANIEELDPEVADLPIALETRENVELNTVMSNSFGFGGTNATLVLQRWTGK